MVPEVFVATHGWASTNYFHQLNQMLPRLALFVPFLKINPHIHIHIFKINNIAKEIITSLGLTNPLVTGDIQAGTVYFPQGSGCDLNPFSVQAMSELVRSHIKSNLLPADQDIQRTVLYIARTKREPKQQKEIMSKLEELCQSYNYRLEVFRDHPVPSIKETMVMFHQASLVIGSHGAGMANLIFSNPGWCYSYDSTS